MGYILLLLFTLTFSFSLAWARPAAPTQTLPSAEHSRPLHTLSSTSTGQDTVYFGGTAWNADSSRWEAIQGGTWTFDSGVGSDFNHSAPDIDPYKNPLLHARMEGWVGTDLTYIDTPYFRWLTSAAFSGPYVCVGDLVRLDGDGSLWAGVLSEEAAALGYATTLPGYGNSWLVSIERAFNYDGGGSAVTLYYEYYIESEDGFDFGRTLVDTTGSGDWVEVASYTGSDFGTEFHSLTPGAQMRTTAGPYRVRFTFESDGSWSQQDGSITTGCGGFGIDEVAVLGGGEGYGETFETGDGGWVLVPAPAGPGGDWTDIRHVNDLSSPGANPNLVGGCPCNLADSVLTFENIYQQGHNVEQDNIAMSPPIDLKAAGLDTRLGRILEFDWYTANDLLNGVFMDVAVQWFPWTHPISGSVGWSPVTYPNSWQYGVSCTKAGAPRRLDLSSLIGYGQEVEQIRVGFRVKVICFNSSYCAHRNPSPYIDNVRLGVYGVQGAPLLAVDDGGLPVDAFPLDGTTQPTSTGRFDRRQPIATSEDPRLFFGDTLTVKSLGQNVETRVVFAVSPGPGIDSVEVTNWLTSHDYEGQWMGLDWYSARMDTAQKVGQDPRAGFWMTAYHEDDTRFSGTDESVDAGDLYAGGPANRLANDIFPDDLFTPGTRVGLFYKARTIPNTSWYLSPDTTGGTYIEMEILPSSMKANGEANLVLYVDGLEGRPGQEVIEAALASVIPGGSENFEQVLWDRLDVTDAPISAPVKFARPPSGQFGATLAQLQQYNTILWSGIFGPDTADAAILKSWLESATPSTPRNLYMGSQYIPHRLYGTTQGQDLLQAMGAEFKCQAVSGACSPLFEPNTRDTSACLEVDAAGGAHFGLTTASRLPGAGCPENLKYDVVSPAVGDTAARGNLRYYNSQDVGTVEFASVSRGPSANSHYRTVLDGFGLHRLRDAGCGTSGAVASRLADVFTWFGGGVVPVDVPASSGAPMQPALLQNAPNPFRTSTRLQFELPARSPVWIRVHDVQGRLVRTLENGASWAPGRHSVLWDGRDDAGRLAGSGIYFYDFRSTGHRAVRKMIRLR